MSHQDNGDGIGFDDEEPDWAKHVEHARRLDDTVAQGVALEAIERDRITFEDRKRFIDSYRRDQKASRLALAEVRDGQAKLADDVRTGLADIARRLEQAHGLWERIAGKVGVSQSEIDDLIKADRARRARDAATDADAAMTRTRLDSLAQEVARVSRTELEPLAAKVDELEDTAQRRLVAEAEAGQVLLRGAAETALRVRLESSADLEREARAERRDELTHDREEKSKLKWWVLGVVAAVVSAAAAGAVGARYGHHIPVEPPSEHHKE